MPRQLPEPSVLSRDFTVAVFVVHAGTVLMQYHAGLRRWLPPGGHIEPHELPDEAAVREVFEETGVQVTLQCRKGLNRQLPDEPVQLCTPAGIQLEQIRPGHQHIDLIYFATGEPAEPREQVGWFGPAEWASLDLSGEVIAWCERALVEAFSPALPGS